MTFLVCMDLFLQRHIRTARRQIQARVKRHGAARRMPALLRAADTAAACGAAAEVQPW